MYIDSTVALDEIRIDALPVTFVGINAAFRKEYRFATFTLSFRWSPSGHCASLHLADASNIQDVAWDCKPNISSISCVVLSNVVFYCVLMGDGVGWRK